MQTLENLMHKKEKYATTKNNDKKRYDKEKKKNRDYQYATPKPRAYMPLSRM